MKRIVTILIVVLLAASAANATDCWQKTSGYRGFADIGVILPVRTDSDFTPLNTDITLSTTHGWQVVPGYLFVGGGVGLDFYLMSVYIPVYADLRTQLPTGKWSPFIDVRLGYGAGFNFMDDFNNALHFAPSVGVTLSTRHRVGFEFMVGYALKEFRAKVTETKYVGGNPTTITDNRWLNGGGLELKFGITF